MRREKRSSSNPYHDPRLRAAGRGSSAASDLGETSFGCARWTGSIDAAARLYTHSAARVRSPSPSADRKRSSLAGAHRKKPADAVAKEVPKLEREGEVPSAPGAKVLLVVRNSWKQERRGAG